MSIGGFFGNIGKGVLGMVPGVDDYFADKEAGKYDKRQRQLLDDNLSMYEGALAPGVTATNPNQSEIDRIQGEIANTQRAAQRMREMGRDDVADQLEAGIKGRTERLEQLQSASPDLGYGGIELDYEVADYAGDVRDMIDQDPRARDAQYGALEYYQDVMDDGMTGADFAALEAQNRRIASDAAARDDAIIQDMRARGVGGAGTEVAARIAGQGNANEAAYMQSLGLTQQRQARRDSAAGSSADLGSTMRDFDQRIAALDRTARQQYDNERARVRNQEMMMNEVELPYKAFFAQQGVQDRTADARRDSAGLAGTRSDQRRSMIYDTADRWRGITGEITGFALSEDQQKAKAEEESGGGGGSMGAMGSMLGAG
jgi:hypothetical protein